MYRSGERARFWIHPRASPVLTLSSPCRIARRVTSLLRRRRGEAESLQKRQSRRLRAFPTLSLLPQIRLRLLRPRLQVRCLQPKSKARARLRLRLRLLRRRLLPPNLFRERVRGPASLVPPARDRIASSSTPGRRQDRLLCRASLVVHALVVSVFTSRCTLPLPPH